MYSVYLLIDPTNDEVRYVGISDNPYRRYGNHLSLGRNSAKSDWILSLMNKELLPKLQIVERDLTRLEAVEREDYWIKFYSEKGGLLNLAQKGKANWNREYKPIFPQKVHIRELRIAKYLTQAELAARAQTTVTVIGKIELIGFIPEKEILERIAHVLGVSVEKLMSEG